MGQIQEFNIISITGIGLVVLCTASQSLASNPLNFVNEAVARGVNFDLGFNYAQVGAGLALLDLDGDGDLDILIAGGDDGEIGVFENDGTGHFTDRTATSRIVAMPMASGISAADYDNDGDLDIHIPGWKVPSKLYRNNGDFTFTNVAAVAGVDLDAPSMAAAWGDYNNDGWMDLYSTVRTFTDGIEIENKLYRNNGDGTFTDVASLLGVQAKGDPSCLPVFFDYDRDGDEDIYIGTDKGSDQDIRMLHNKLYRNNGDGTFTNATYEAEAEAWIFCMGIAIGDMNFDGYFDMYLTNIPRGNKLLMYDGVSAYQDQTLEAGVESKITGWATVMADFDNDTHLDIYVCNMQGPNRLYRGSDTWPLIDEAVEAGVDVANDVFCVAVGDVDGDNDLDMLVGNTNGRVNLFINYSTDLRVNNWVRFNVVGNNGNSYGVGTCVDLKASGTTQVRQVRSGVNYKAQEEYTLHFGLDKVEHIDLVQVIYPGGELRILTGAPINTVWTLYPESRLGDPNNNGKIEIEELAQAIAARTPPGMFIQPGQEIFDMDGDFDIDANDLALMGLRMVDPTSR
ncbi:MAG: CRTAC1 family protein [Phycisphaerales bacterium]|nr:CRTAC1 family protein [Phycisphaerales bacterium]